MGVGILSAYDSAPAFDKAAVFISASYNIAIKNITVARAGYGYVASGGDYGFVYCGNTQLQLTKQKGLVLENATFQLTRARGGVLRDAPQLIIMVSIIYHQKT